MKISKIMIITLFIVAMTSIGVAFSYVDNISEERMQVNSDYFELMNTRTPEVEIPDRVFPIVDSNAMFDDTRTPGPEIPDMVSIGD